MTIEDLLSRADDETLQDLVGRSIVRLLGRLDSALTSPSSLRNLVLASRSLDILLLLQESRFLLLDLLRPDEAQRLAAMLELAASSDTYASLKSVRLARGSDRERRLFLFFDSYPPAAEEADSTPSTETSSPAYGLFPHQRRAVREATEMMCKPPRRVLLHLPTGSGKTRSAMNIIADHLRQHEPGLVIWLAYSEELCDQACDEFQKAWSHIGNRDLSLHRFWGKHTLDLESLGDGIIVAGLPKLFRAAMKDLKVVSTLGARASLLVVDEAHQAIAPTFKMILEALFAMNTESSLLGLTATPGRTWSDIAADEELATFFGRNKVMLRVDGYSNPIEYLTDAGYLARVEFRSLLYSGGREWSDADAQRIADEFDIPPHILELLGEDELRNLQIVNEAEKLVQRHTRILIFAASVRHSELISSVLQARGHRARSVTGMTQSSERSRIISDFRDADPNPKIICNFGVLTTGFDAPRTSAVLIARPTKSLVLYSQMIGRAVRGMRAGGNESAEVITVVDQGLPGFGSLSDAFNNWEDVWTQP